VSERERFAIDTLYYLYVTGELDKAAQAYQLWQQTYPRDPTTYLAMAYISARLGNWEDSLAQSQEAMRQDPNNWANYNNLGNAYTCLNKLRDAEAVYTQAEQRKLVGEALLASRYNLVFLQGDTERMAQFVLAAVGKAGMEEWLLAAQADSEAWHGKLKNAHELTQRAMDSAEHNDAKETAAIYQAAAALREVGAGNQRQGHEDADGALKLASSRDVQEAAALALARASDTTRAENLAAALNKSFPLDTLVQRYWLPSIEAAVALDRKDPKRAIEVLRVTSPIELAQAAANFNVFLCPAYLRGEAYLMLHDGPAAAAEFRKFIDHYGLVVNFPWGALARLGLARAYALDAAKDPAARDKARATYKDFLTLWKDADPDVPVLIQAKAEYAKLQ
jgi:tetratricopeptide (TPR) repeat protein